MLAQQAELLKFFQNQKPKQKHSGEGKQSQLIAEYSVPTGGKIQVRHGDMTEERVDAIVNAANKHLDHGSGLAGAIKEKGGFIIQAESDEYVDRNGPLEDGAVVALSSGNLPCKNVIHAVGPIWHGGNMGEGVFLSMCVRSCLDTANKLKAKSLSMPAISTGIFRFPKPTCAEIMFDTVLHYFKETKKEERTLSEVRFTNFDDETVYTFKTEFEKRFGVVSDETKIPEQKDAKSVPVKVDLTKVEQPKVEQPKVEQPKVEQPKVEQPKVEQPKVEQPKVEQPKVEQPIVRPPQVDTKGEPTKTPENTDKKE